MTHSVSIVAWHIHPGATICQDCGRFATVQVSFDMIDSFDLCGYCLQDYPVKEDKIEEVFRKLDL